MKILMLSSTFPYPPSRGGTEIRTFNLLKYLHQHHAVTLVTQSYGGISEREITELRQWTKELMIFPLPPDPKIQGGIGGGLRKIQRFIQSIIQVTPPNVQHRYSLEIQELVDNFVATGKCDVITCEHSVNEIYIRPEYRSKVKTIVNVHSSVYAWTRNHLEAGASTNIWRDRLYLGLLYAYEKRYCQKFTNIVATTEDDRKQFLQFHPSAEIAVIPNGVDLDLFPYRDRDPNGRELIFVGAMDASHNIDAASFFALEVLPILQKSYPEIVFKIVGARPTPAVLALNNHPGVIVTGAVDSMVEQLHAATIAVIPLRTGFGIKNKTLEAMAAGIPVVGSDRGLEGLEVDGENTPLRALRANSVAAYVQAISQLLVDAELRSQVSKNARIHIETTYTWSNAGRQYEQILGCFDIPD